MSENILKPDYVFEVSWEVCNKMGGIHTVLSTKALSMGKELQDRLIFIGPDFWRGDLKNPEFIQDDSLFQNWRLSLGKEKIKVKIGRWNIVGKPIAVLVDFTSAIAQKNEISSKYWEDFKLDSLSGHWEYTESLLFGHMAGRVIESFYKFFLPPNQKVVAHFHEWMTGSGVLYLKTNLSQVSTVFSTHATVVGRSLAGNGLPIYDHLSDFDGDSRSHEMGVVSKHSLEKLAANNADCFATVSDITARECQQLLYRPVDVVTPNGFEADFVPKGTDFPAKRDFARKELRRVAEALLGYKLSDDVLFVANSGRYEYKNKGIDVFLDSLRLLSNNSEQKREILAFTLIPANTSGARQDLKEKLADPKSDIQLDNPFLTHGLNEIGWDPIMNKVQDIHFTNSKEEKVKLIFVPSYLNGDDGIFNMHYYDLLIGMDLTVFPSYYEPWGYTPLESLAFSIPTITTNLAGFGIWTKQFAKSLNDGIEVITRTDSNQYEAAVAIANAMHLFSIKSAKEVEKIRTAALKLSKTAEWSSLVEKYFVAYDIALKKVVERKGHFALFQTEARVKVESQPSHEPVWKTIVVKATLPDALLPLREIANNLWWSWNYEAVELFDAVDSDLWDSVNKNPIVLLERVKLERLEQLTKEVDFVNKLNRVYAAFQVYMAKPFKHEPRIAYFSMEYGISDVLKIFSGGLGVLAGDYLKEASDSCVDMVAVGLLYRFGYFRQSLSLNGEQLANQDMQFFNKLPVEEVKMANGESLYVSVEFPGRMVHAKVWKAMVGRVPLYLMDCDNERNNNDDRDITHNLYGGNWENRLKQEILLGLGGIRLLNSLNAKPDIYHCNEGHAALINVQRLMNLVQEKFSFAEAMELVRASSLFTTHTPVPAGHDKFDEDLFRVYLRHIPDMLTISWDEFMNLGREIPGNRYEKFSMSALAARTSQEVNGVSWLHGEVSKEMFKEMYPGYFEQELHIGYVTNGVHYGTWTSKEWRRFYEDRFGDDFLDNLSDKEYWRKINHVSDEEVWKIKSRLRSKLVEYMKKRISKNMATRSEDPANIIQILNRMNEKSLTIGFARRFATYKRAHLLFTDLERLSKIVNNPARPVQFIFAGKAHPADGGGQGLIKHIVEISRRPEFLGKIIFLENYDMELAKRLVSGVDVWLNTPTRPLEASGTSGEKAELNGTLNFSVKDGWWYEGYVEGAGWALTEKQTYENHEHQDELDAATIYRMLENEIIPLYYDQDIAGVPHRWVQYIKRSISEIAPEYTTKRMIDDYLNRFYSKLYARSTDISKNDYKKVRELAKWKRNFLANWGDVKVVAVEVPDIRQQEIKVSDIYKITVELDLVKLKSEDVGVELVYSDGANIEKDELFVEEFLVEAENDSKVIYSLAHKLSLAGEFKFGLRIFARNSDLPHKMDFCYVRWI